MHTTKILMLGAIEVGKSTLGNYIMLLNENILIHSLFPFFYSLFYKFIYFIIIFIYIYIIYLIINNK